MRIQPDTNARIEQRETNEGPCTVLVAPPGRVPFLLEGDEYIFVPADLARKFNSTEWLSELFRGAR